MRLHLNALFFILVAAGITPLLGGETSAAIPFTPNLKLNDQERIVLERFVGHAATYAAGLTPEKVQQRCAESPEMFAWVEFPYLDCLLDAYELTGDLQYLDKFKNAFTLFTGILETGDDGLKGWYGKPIPPRRLADRPDLKIDELQMNFRAVGILSHWVELARRQPDYAAANQATIAEYLDLMEKHLFPKWDSRGFFADLNAEGGVYRGLDYPLCNPAKPGTTLSHEKSSIIVNGLLGLYRITGNSLYMRRALQLGTRFKHCLSIKDGHYEWMSWEPAGTWDISPTKEDSWTVGWIAPDPKAEWYIASVSIAVNLYQCGLVFDDEDIARFVATQKTRCWNGDWTNPQYRTVAGVSKADNKNIDGQFLSRSLSLYDPDLFRLAFAGPHEAGILEQSTNSWKGCVGMASYVRAKYLVQPLLAGGKQPFARTGEKFLTDPGNRSFYEKLKFPVTAPGKITPLKPSQITR